MDSILDHTIVKNYIIMKFIASGSYGDVYEATDIKKGMTVAIKVINKKKIICPEILTKCIPVQIELLQACKNQNVIKYFDHFEERDSIFIVTEFCNGGDLEKLLRKEKRLTEDQAIQFLKQILNGFKGLHEAETMHRDFKLPNVLLHNRIAKIADLGLAKKMGQFGVTGTICGTPLTMAPQVLDEKPYGWKADIWSIGVVYYQMIFGDYPFKATNRYDLIKKLQSQRPDFSHVEISKHSRDFIERCLTFDPVKRIDWKEIHQHPLFDKNQVRLLFGVRSRVFTGQNQNFYKNKSEIENLQAEIKMKKLPSRIHNENSEKEKEASEIINKEKLIEEKERKEEREKNIHEYEKIYVQKRNSIMFLFKYLNPYTDTLVKYSANHGITLFITAKKAYIDVKNFIEAVKKRKNIFQLRKDWFEFTKSFVYQEIAKQLEEDLEMIEAQTFSYFLDIEGQNKSPEIEAEKDMNKVVSKNWEALVKDIVSQYWFMLAEPIRNRVPKEEGEKKNREILVKVLTALEFYTENKDLDAERFEETTKNFEIKDAEIKVRQKLKRNLIGQ